MSLVINDMLNEKDSVLEKDEEKILEILNQLRPYLNSEGGDFEYIKYEDDYVYIKLYGACATCGFKDFTIQDSIFASLKEEIPTLKGVINLEL